MVDQFIGKFVVESKDNYDGFMKGVGKFVVVEDFSFVMK